MLIDVRTFYIVSETFVRSKNLFYDVKHLYSICFLFLLNYEKNKRKRKEKMFSLPHVWFKTFDLNINLKKQNVVAIFRVWNNGICCMLFQFIGTTAFPVTPCPDQSFSYPSKVSPAWTSFVASGYCFVQFHLSPIQHWDQDGASHSGNEFSELSKVTSLTGRKLPKVQSLGGKNHFNWIFFLSSIVRP